uniref:Uncharacterized protein n=1 Tax=Triticum urartu TaxID=4572 RepID=A0A8R7QLH8_TRIUA
HITRFSLRCEEHEGFWAARSRRRGAAAGRGRPRERQRGVDRHAGHVLLHAEAGPPRRRRQRVRRGRLLLLLRRVRGGREHVPRLRHHRRPGHPPPGARRLLRADLPRDHRLLLGEAAEPGRRSVLRARPHATHSRAQLPVSRGRAGAGPGEEAGPGVDRPRGGLQDGHLVLDDAATWGAQDAVVPRRDDRRLEAVAQGPPRREAPRVRHDHQHHQRRAGVRQAPRHAPGQGSGRVLQEVLPPAPCPARPQRGLHQPEAVRARWLID